MHAWLMPPQQARVPGPGASGPQARLVAAGPPWLRRAPTASLSALACPPRSNAGTNAYRVGPLAQQSAEDIVAVVETNVVGVMLGTLRLAGRGGAERACAGRSRPPACHHSGAPCCRLPQAARRRSE